MTFYCCRCCCCWCVCVCVCTHKIIILVKLNSPLSPVSSYRLQLASPHIIKNLYRSFLFSLVSHTYTHTLTHILWICEHQMVLFLFLFKMYRSSRCGSAVTSLTSIHEDAGSIPGLDQWVKDLALPWLWCRLAVEDLIWPLPWELPYPTAMALRKQKYKNSNLK